MTQLGYQIQDLLPLKDVGISTARSGDQLEILGELPEDIHLQLDDTDIILPSRPVVLRDLAMPFNICGPFLQKHGIDQLHSQNALKCRGKLLRLTPCESLAIPARKHDPESSLVVIAEETIIQPFKSAIVSLLVLDVVTRRMPEGEGVIYASDHFMKQTDSNPTLCSLVDTSQPGFTYTQVLNTSNQPIRLKKHTAFGTYRPLDENDREQPWKVSAIQRPTLRAKIKDLLERCKKENEHRKDYIDPKAEAVIITDDDKREWLYKAFRIHECPQLKNDDSRTAVVELLLKYWACISVNGEFGKTPLLQHEIHTTPGPPITTRYRPVNPALLPDLRKQIDDLLHHDVIEPSKSPWSFALVAAPKKNGKIRWCVDYRRLNAITTRDQFPLPNIEDNLARLSKSKVFQLP